MSKSIIWRRSRREREEKKAGTCAHVRGIEFGRERRWHIGKLTRARVRTMKGKRKGGHRVYTWGYENRARFFDTERGKPAQKPTPTSRTHRSHPKEIRIMNIEKGFGKILKNAAIRKTQFQCIASTTDPGPTAWRLLYLGTRGLTSISVGLLFAPANTTSLSADKGVSVLPILPVFASGNRL
ncbi:LOW QUALITY PROTEIN: hypothetical protein V1477_000414 [Vespula maculifrons]|uniref:Uncharacterized protein n=1 Tax=Vespula maculifrons TaxID=7453 RepID=A0ABD2D1L1_VESMC